MSKKTKTIIIIVSIIAVVGIVIGGLLWMLRPVTIQDRLESSSTYKTIESIVKVDEREPVSVVIAEATQDWWNILLKYNSNPELPNVNFSNLTENAQFIAYTASQGADYDSAGDLALGTTFIFYTNEQAAADAAVNLTGVSYTVKENVIAFIKPGAFSDVDYNFVDFYQVEQELLLEDLNLNGRAIMQINFQGFTEAYTEGYPEERTEVFKNFSALMGITPESGWVGYSTDGLTWSGQFYGLDIETVTAPSTVFDYFNQQQLIELKDGTLVPMPQEGDPIIPEEDQTGFIFPRQSNLFFFMVYETANDSGGQLINPTTNEVLEEAEVLTDGNLLRVKMDIVPWLTIMLDDSTSSIVSPFSTVELIVSDLEGRSTIIFEPNS